MRDKKVNKNSTISDTKAISMLFLFYIVCDVFSIGCLLIWGVSPYASERFSDRWVGSIMVAPLLETLIVHLPLIWLFSKLKMHPVLIVLITAILFALLHLPLGAMYPVYIFYPGLIMSWAFYYFYKRCGVKVAILTATFVHGSHNFTSLMC
jgi:membrane protease YdiL (CAAX protease family)